MSAYANNRDVFVDMVRALSARGWTKSRRTDSGAYCAYVAPGCAIGVCRGVGPHAEQWDTALHGRGISISGVKDRFPDAFRSIFGAGVDPKFLSACQSAHDCADDCPGSMASKFAAVARYWGIAMPADVAKALNGGAA